MEQGKNGCGCSCHKTLGILIAFIGVVFLLGHFDVIGSDTVDILWPVLVILIGIKKAYGRSICKCCSGSGTPK